MQPHLAFHIQTGRGAVVPAGLPITLTLDVGPRDSKRLQDVCRKLATTAVSPSSGSALQAAEVLSYVLDLEAVPYLAKIAELEDPVLHSTAVEGLARIAQAEGLGAVLGKLGPSRKELQADIKQDLYNMQHNVKAMD